MAALVIWANVSELTHGKQEIKDLLMHIRIGAREKNFRL